MLSLAVLAFAVWNQAGPLAAAASALLALAITARVWSAFALGSVTCTLEFHDDRAFPDDEVDLDSEGQESRSDPDPLAGKST